MKINDLSENIQRIIIIFAIIILSDSIACGQTENTLQSRYEQAENTLQRMDEQTGNLSRIPYGKIGDDLGNPIVAGTFSNTFKYSNSQNTTSFTNNYTASRSTNDVFHKFTLSKPMTVIITHCGSTLGDTYMSLLNSSGTLLPPVNDDYSGEGHCSTTFHSYMKRDLPVDTYYVVSEGYSQNGVILINISGQPLPVNNLQNPIVAGTFSSTFHYTNTQNTALFTNDFTNRSPNDVFYKFTLTKTMHVVMSHCGSSIDTYMHLLDASGKVIVSNDDYFGDERCSSSSLYSVISKILDAGTYYVVSEGYSQSNSITTNINGLDSEFNYPELPNAYNTDPGVEPGSIAGSFNVSATGAATYTIPIEVPPGVGGMQPSMAITYNSQSGNGIAGWGCNLSGVSAITRAPKSIYYDGTAKGLTHSMNEAYLLDGQRLILYSGTAGNDGAVYYLESDPFTKVTVHAVDANSFIWFEVLAKNGTKYYYGQSLSSRQSYHWSYKVNAWYINYVEDVLGNYMNYTYVCSNYSYRLSSIVYGKNKNVSSSLENTIFFEYSSRSDIIPFMLETVNGNISHKLYKITCKTGTSTFREYILNYANSDHFSRLTSVTEKNGAGETLKPTTFNWSFIPSVASYRSDPPSITGSLTNLSDQYYTSADLNGDGVSDLISFTLEYKTPSNKIRTLSQHYISNRQSDGSYKYVAYNPRYLPANMNLKEIGHIQGSEGQISFNALGDGKQCVLVPFFLSNGWGPQVMFYVYGIEGLLIVPEPDINDPVELLEGTTQLPLYITGDVYNNGKDAVVVVEQQCKNNKYPGKIGQLVSLCPPEFDWVNLEFVLDARPEKIFMSDFDGDGMNDILIFYNGGYSIFWNQGGSVPYSYSKTTKNTNIGYVFMIRMGDFNGDGLSDFIMNATGDNQWYFAINTGNGTFTKQLACTLGYI
jgi:hypothetical protein